MRRLGKSRDKSSEAGSVLILTADFVPHNWSGIGVAVEAQVRALAARGWRVAVLWASPKARDSVTSEGVRVYAQDVHRFRVDPREFDVVHVHSLALTELATELCQRYALPLVATLHSIVEDELEPGPERDRWSAVQRHLFAVCDAIVFTSESERRRAQALFLQRHIPSAVVPNGVDADGVVSGAMATGRVTPEGMALEVGVPEAVGARRVVTEAVPPELRGDTVLFAGRWARSKGTAVVTELIRRLAPRGRARFVLAVGHANADDMAELAALERSCGDHCQVLPWLGREELRRCYARAAVTLIPSEYEPFGLVALEAMSAGCPVLARATGGLIEIVRPTSGGLLVSGGDPAGWERELVALLDDRDRRRALERAGPVYVTRHFGSERSARCLESVYRGLWPRAVGAGPHGLLGFSHQARSLA